MIDAAADAGIAAVEVTLDSPSPLEIIRAACRRHPDLAIGAGTVRTADDATSALAAGASFIVSPILADEVVAVAVAAGVPVVPGAATPTEIWRVIQSGAPMVKIFPARELGGPAFIEAVSGPLDRPRLIPTGGVDVTNGPDFLAAGAVALGIGAALFPADALAAGDSGEVSRRGREILEALG